MSLPINKTNLNSPDIISSELVVWEGPSIPCIDICTGEKVSSVVAKIGTKICSLFEDLETLKTLDYKCIIEKLDYNGELVDPTKFSLKALFQLLLHNDCKLEDLISNISGNTSNQVNLVGLDLKCITNEVLNLCGQIPDNLEINKLAQAIINILCEIQDEVASMLIRILTLESRFNQLGDPGSGGYVEPYIGPVPIGAPSGSVGTPSSCLNPNTSLLMRDHIVDITDKKICELEELIGSKDIIDTTISNQCLSDYVGNSEINFNASTLADTMKNKEVILCDLQARLKSIEDTCCSFSCDDIKIGYTQAYNSSTNIYKLDFTFGAGTNIPLVFTDCGSTFILTDWKGVVYEQNNSSGLLTNGSTFTINLTGSGLDVVKPINLQIKTCFTNLNNGLICKDCFGGTLDASANNITSTCWLFNIPNSNILGCNDKFLNYDSVVLSKNTYNFNNSNTSDINNNLNVPVLTSSSPISNMFICGNNNQLSMTIAGQSTLIAPQIKLVIANTAPLLFIYITGTLNPSCTC